ncbi:acetylserotonin O-methyltransferase-like [Bombina bombina]|uniref:acetylserotonin O-methyltransferase-like n=1 Tax=Bombina bombina TaxID=8345 RepID=UPI00235AFE89|nr:acetylserotonin O-methyltransferase-like [Bombina bombina]
MCLDPLIQSDKQFPENLALIEDDHHGACCWSEIKKEYLPPAAVLLTQKTLFTACELGVFDVLSQSEDPLSAATLAERLGTSPTGMERLLNACVGLKLLERNMLNGEAVYKSPELSNLYLAKTSPKSINMTLQFLSKEVYAVANYFDDAVREGTWQQGKTFGIPSGESFNVLYRSEEKMSTFMGHMDGFWNLRGKEEFISKFDLSSFHTICDLGGCSGTLAKVCAAKYPESSVIVYDLPDVVNAANKYKAAEEHQITFQQGDFFKDPIPEADLFILGYIIHDWAEDKCLHLLRKIYNICKPGGGILMAEAIINEDRSGPVHAQMLDLLMLILTEGRERTAKEYAQLLNAVGFKDIRFRSNGNLSEAILAIK